MPNLQTGSLDDPAKPAGGMNVHGIAPWAGSGRDFDIDEGQDFSFPGFGPGASGPSGWPGAAGTSGATPSPGKPSTNQSPFSDDHADADEAIKNLDTKNANDAATRFSNAGIQNAGPLHPMTGVYMHGPFRKMTPEQAKAHLIDIFHRTGGTGGYSTSGNVKAATNAGQPDTRTPQTTWDAQFRPRIPNIGTGAGMQQTSAGSVDIHPASGDSDTTQYPAPGVTTQRVGQQGLMATGDTPGIRAIASPYGSASIHPASTSDQPSPANPGGGSYSDVYPFGTSG